MMGKQVNVAAFLEQITAWAATRPDVASVALVGSHARGTARADSDVDLVILCASPAQMLHDDWPLLFGEVESSTLEDYGALKSLRVHYRGGLEVEFGLADRSWAHRPLDAGTRRVLEGRARVLYDPEQIFRMAMDAVIA